MPPKPLLYIDDNLHDQFLVREAIRFTGSPFDLVTAHDIRTAERNLPPFSSIPILILVDFDLGLLTGVDFLLWIRRQTVLANVPVIIYSGSVGGRHIAECYAAGANQFLRKSATFKGIQQIVRALARCVKSFPIDFQPLTELPEYIPPPATVP